MRIQDHARIQDLCRRRDLIDVEQMARYLGGTRRLDERDIPLNTPEGQRLLGARDLIAEEAFEERDSR
jgi:hypothetical protein